ncbi:MAG: trigger factor, partial [Gemmatimonadetes bacterium]|nr:trigger factor [Gemmatimonadota bacterium]
GGASPPFRINDSAKGHGPRVTTETTDIQVTTESPSAWARRLTITIPAERIEQERKTAVQRLAKSTKLPGFRKGKVPPQVMEKRFGAALQQQAVEQAIGAAYRDAIQREGLKPITEGSIGEIEYQPGSDLTFHVDVEVRPELELERIGGFRLRRDEPRATEAQVEEVIGRLREERTHYHPAEARLAGDGDLVDFEVTPLDDATEATPAVPRRYQVVIGQGQAVPAIEAVLRQLRPGESGEYDMELPVAADDPAQGTRPHRMRMHVLEVKEAHAPELDDDFARGLGNFGSLAELREQVRADLRKESEKAAEQKVRGQLLHEIVQANPFEVPYSMVKKYVEAMLPAREGADPERLAGLRQQAWPAAEQALQRMLVIERVAELEGLDATPAEVQDRVSGIAERLGRPAAEVTAQLRKSGRLDEIDREITEEKVFDYLKSLSTIE